MRHAFVPLLFAATVSLSACATSGEMASVPPSQLSVAEINAELATISEEQRALFGGEVRRFPVPAMAHHRPLRVTYVDSTGAVMSNYTPADVRDVPLPQSFGSSRPFAYARLQALADRTANLYAELRQRGVSQ